MKKNSSREGAEAPGSELGDRPSRNGDTLNGLMPRYLEATARMATAQGVLLLEETKLRLCRDAVAMAEQEHANLASRLEIWWNEHRDKVSGPLLLRTSGAKIS